ncbi:hypothetical protein GQE99_11855 [Maritimibacter sp. DP07]|uniref:Extracellular solute-binding protein, family 7 n=1 Tax=Maritimibacter harenae TaxID=2606218 RepID=A0A845M080_9RHOB|nr:hypothetical protein [Maritimibacter harenae]MZR13710.1 hypothetical protein [Maritimibacter harenae]
MPAEGHPLVSAYTLGKTKSKPPSLAVIKGGNPMKFLKAGVATTCLISSQAVAADLPYSLPFNDESQFTKIGKEWAAEVAEATDGALTLEPVTNAALVSIPETLDALESGVVPAAMGVASSMAGMIPAFGYLELNLSVPIDNPPTEEAIGAVFPVNRHARLTPVLG